MSINRISSSYMSNKTIYRLQNNLGLLEKLNEQIASGRNINRASDDPVGLTRIVDVSNTINLEDRFTRNIQNALSELRVSDQSLGNVEEIVHRAMELANQGATFTVNSDGRRAIAEEIDHMIDQLTQLANTSIGGKYIYSGFRTDTAPYSRAVDTVTYSGTAAGEAYQRTAEIAENNTIDINLRGEDLFGSVTVAAGAVTGGAGLFRTLMQLRIDLNNNNPNAVRNRITDLQTDLDTIMGGRSSVGALTNRLEMTLNRLEERKSTLTQQYAEIQEVDMAKAISNLNFQESIFQASLGVSARVLQPSLLQFLG